MYIQLIPKRVLIKKKGKIVGKGMYPFLESCEIACKEENTRPPGEWGIRVQEVAPEITGGKLYYFPFPTDKCNLCGKRLAKGRQPACVHSCWAKVMKFGVLEELAEHAKKKSRTVIWVPH